MAATSTWVISLGVKVGIGAEASFGGGESFEVIVEILEAGAFSVELLSWRLVVLLLKSFAKLARAKLKASVPAPLSIPPSPTSQVGDSEE